MLENIREGVKKPWVKIVVFAIVISFVFAGYFSSSFFSGDPNAVAIVNGESISRTEFQRSYLNQKNQQAEYYRANVKTEEDERNFQESVLQQMITLKVREQAIADLGLRVSGERLRETIQSDPNYQVDGKYSKALVDQVIVNNRISSEQFKQFYMNSETVRQLITGVIDSEIGLAQEIKNDYELTAQKRTGKALSINYAPIREQLEISEENIAEYYQNNQENFRIEEKVSVDYIELSVPKLLPMQEVSAQELQEYYVENQDRYRADEQRQISHILILSKDDEDAALERITAIKARIDAGEDFAAIASAESDDIPTRESGGDLGILLPGAMEESFDKAANELEKAGDVSDPVKSNFGYHLIKLTAFVEGSVQPLEQVKEDLENELKKAKAEEAFFNKSELLERFAFEVADSLDRASQETGVTVETSEPFGKSSRDGIFANAAVKEAAFSSDVKEALRNSSPIQLGENHIVVVRLKETIPSIIQPLEDVKARVETSLKQEKAKEKAQQLSDQILEKLKAETPIEDILTENKLAWVDLDKVQRNNASLSYLSNQQFFKMPAPEEGTVSFDSVEDFQGFTILMLNNVEKGDWATAEEAIKKQRELFVTSYFANAVFNAFIEDRRKNSEVQRNLENLPQ